MIDAIGELLKQAKVLIGERTPGTAKSRQALNLLSKAPKVDRETAGPAKFRAAMGLRNYCQLFRSAPADQRPAILQIITIGVTLLEALPDDAGHRDRYWLER